MDKLGEELFDLAYQEGKSVQECLYDVYNKGRVDAIDEFYAKCKEKYWFSSDFMNYFDEVREQLKSQN